MGAENASSAAQAILNLPVRGTGTCPDHAPCGLCTKCEDRARKVLATIAIESQRRRKQSVEPGSESWDRAKNKLMRLLCALDLLPESELDEDKQEAIEQWVAYCEGMHKLGTEGAVTK